MARSKKLNDIPLEDLNQEINARASVMASEMILADDNHVVRHPFSRMRVRTVNDEPSMTHQAHAESCDINNIIRQFDRTGLLPPATRPARFADVSNLNKDLTELYADMQDIGARIQAAQAELAVAQAKASDESASYKPSSEPVPSSDPTNPSPV